MIDIQAVSKSFLRNGQTFQAVKAVDLHIKKGEIFGLIGQSGAGKSTLLRFVNGLVVPDEGTVSIDGKVLDYQNAKAMRLLRREVGMVFQGYQLLNQLTVEANILLPLKLQGKASAGNLDQILDMVGLSGLAKAYPRDLSGGQKQRVGIARALMIAPKILLLDEPTSALDEHTSQEIATALGEINQSLGITILLVTHQVSMVQALCDRASLMDGGKLFPPVTLDPSKVYPYQSYQDYIKGVLGHA